jgi:hypothetical protein
LEPAKQKIRVLEAKIRELQTTAATAEEKFGEDLRRTKAELI